MPRRVTAPVTHAPTGLTPEPVCRTCKNHLEFHQPDTARPQRLLGICDFCHSWNLFGIGDDCRVHIVPPDPA